MNLSRLSLNHSNSKGHGSGLSGSGSSTPGRTGANTPLHEDDSTVVSVKSEGSYVNDNNEKLQLKRKESFGKANLVGLSTISSSSSETTLPKEHSEQGRVKWDVYYQYMQAASWIGCGVFLILTILQQAVSVLSTVVLRAWGEHNRESGSNSDLGKYLFAYGMSSLVSVLLGAASAIIVWVFISLRSAQKLHDSVSGIDVAS